MFSVDKVRLYAALFSVLFFVVGCGGGGTAGGGAQAQSPAGQAPNSPDPVVPPPTVGEILIRHTLLTRSVPAYVDQFRFSGLDTQGAVIYGPTVRDKAAEILLRNVPVEVSRLRIEYLQNGALVGLGEIPVTLRPGESITVSDPSFEDVEAQLERLILSTDSISIAKGTSTSLTVQGVMNTGETQDFSASALWSTDDSSIADFNGSLLEGLAVGNTVYTARVGPIEASGTIEVTDAELTALRFSPGTLTLPKGRTATFQIEALFSDNSIQTLNATPTSNNENVAELLDNTTVSAVEVGTAELLIQVGNVNATLSVEVTPSVLESMTLDPPNLSVPAGYSEKVLAFGNYSDGSIVDITNQVTWSSDHTEIATVANVGEPGSVHARMEGSTTIRATLDSVQGQSTVQVTPALLESISLTPNSTTLNIGFQDFFTAEGLFSDGTTRQLQDLLWTSEQPSVASISPYGAVKGKNAGTTTVRAQKNGKEATVLVEVVDRKLTSITLTPGTYTQTYVGLTEQFQAQGLFDDGKVEDLTDQVNWWSTREGLLETLGNGSFLAHHPGRTEVKAFIGSVANKVPINVEDAKVVSLEVTGPAGPIPVNTDHNYRAFATYTDGITREVTYSADWRGFRYGEWEEVSTLQEHFLTPRVAGEYLLSASYDRISDGIDVTVQDIPLTSVDVVKPNVALPRYYDYDFRAFGNFSDGSRYPVNNSVTWSSTENFGLMYSSGKYSGEDVGTDTVTATHDFANLNGQATVEVSAARPASVEIVESSVQMRVNESVSPNIVVTFDNGFQTSETRSVSFDLNSSPYNALSLYSSGTVSANAQGGGVLTASVTNADGEKRSDTVSISVLEELPRSLYFSDRNLTLPADLHYQLICRALFTFTFQPPPVDYSERLDWSSTNPRVASVSNDPGSKGLLKTKDEGATVIKARDPQSGVEGRIAIKVVRKNLTKLRFDGGATYLQTGAPRQLEVYAHFDDGTFYEIGQAVDWSSSNASLLTVSTQGASKGALTTVGTGTATVEVTEPKSGLTASQEIEVADSVLVSSVVSSHPYELKLSRNGESLFSVQDTALTVYDETDLSVIHTRTFSRANCFAESPDGRYLYVGEYDSNMIVRIDLQDFSEQLFSFPSEAAYGLTAMEMVEKNYLILGLRARTDRLAVLNLDTGVLTSGPSFWDPEYMEVRPNTKEILVGSRDGVTDVVRYAVSGPNLTFLEEGVTRGELGIDISPSGDGFFYLTGGGQTKPGYSYGTIYYAMEDMSTLLAFFDTRFIDVAFSPDETVIYGGGVFSSDNFIRIASLVTSRYIGEVPVERDNASIRPNFVITSKDSDHLFIQIGGSRPGNAGSLKKLRIH